jgi:signal transduction histidine kinase
VNDDITTIKGADAARGSARGSVVSRLGKLFIDDVTDEYRQVAEEFMDPATLEERFDRESIACQYMSKTKGWCLVRLFAIDRREGEPLRRFIFTIQNINDEKTEMDEIEDSITGSENETAGIVPESVPYSIRDIVDEALADASEEAELRGIEVTSDIAADLPEKLTGDPGKLRMVIACMLLSALRHAGGKSIRLSLFAKETKDGREHLLVSVRDSGDGKKDDEKDFGGLGLRAAEEMLRIMDSELRSIYEEGAGSELYFEIEQEKA